jgi:hypothetical protein
VQICALPGLSEAIHSQCPANCLYDYRLGPIVQGTSPAIIKRMFQSLYTPAPEMFSIVHEHESNETFVNEAHIAGQQSRDHSQRPFEEEYHEQLFARALQNLDEDLLSKIMQAFSTEAQWLDEVSKGMGTSEKLDRLAEKPRLPREVDIVFTIRDLPGADDILSSLKDAKKGKSGDAEQDKLELLERFANHCDDIKHKLHIIWRAKFLAVHWLKLESITLDVRNAHGPDGEFLAHADWIGTLPRFRHGLPEIFNIVADSEQGKEVSQAFADVEEGRLSTRVAGST